MGLVYADLVLKNAKFEKSNKIRVNALVDTGSFYLCIPEYIREELELEEFEKRQVKLAGFTRCNTNGRYGYYG